MKDRAHAVPHADDHQRPVEELDEQLGRRGDNDRHGYAIQNGRRDDHHELETHLSREVRQLDLNSPCDDRGRNQSDDHGDVSVAQETGDFSPGGNEQGRRNETERDQNDENTLTTLIRDASWIA